ncbi:methyltransferase N6AMT1 [Prorops nasuta]|uniref:methyltransferase N6AMT1 n=1 Tax=Prorops nasuta TaxID=863751 RepID=UPI0034CF37F1
METPMFHLSYDETSLVYEPAEDSFLLIDALEADLETLKAIKPLICLELGSGTGIVITALAKALKKVRQSHYLAVDLNPLACRVTKRISKENCVDVDAIQMDLSSCIQSRNIIDIVVFNPPYVVTSSSEVTDVNSIYKAWAGGKHGREVMERVFKNIPQLLSDSGIFYLLVIKENEPEQIIETFRKLNMKGDIILERKIRGEHLYVLRFRKK